MNIFKFLFRPKLDKEAYEAFFNRLPSTIAVNWFRSGKFIVGNIIVDDEKFMTQGRDANEFISMVNETIYAVYDIPDEYFENLPFKNYSPRPEEYERLKNVSIQGDTFSTQKVKQLQTA